MPGIWSRHRDEITIDRLQKFWNELPIQARNNLLRIDKQTLFEQARKNLYCSRCNGLLLESFTQIVMYGKSLQQHHEGSLVNSYMDQEDDVAQDPAVHPWGGLAATKDGLLTLLDCFIHSRSLTPLQTVFDSARAREREREMLYPDACGGEGRGWISQTGGGTGGYGRGHGTRETCALHTARLSCDTLMDFWSALGDETRASLLQMKEDDFIERLMYRFDSKRFCRDCRRNVIREFKELKELKRLRREPRCNVLFCGADTAFQYEVLETSIEADWQDFFTDGKYHHFEWGVGTSEGKSDICEFKNIGLITNISRTDLDLSQHNSLFIGLRAWRNDGKCNEYCVKAHAMKGQLCVHRRLIVGDGVVSITKGESMRLFFEHAEEAEEEDEEEAMERDGSDMDGEGSHPQKHAKSPELAREFLLDAATVIFKEQVEKAFREGTARQNAHSVFVSLALKLLEDRVHVACKEIITLEKQTMLLEEEEKEKREEEERKERRRNKEREKKLRRKERLKGKENREKETEQETESHTELELESKSPSEEFLPESPKSPKIPDYSRELELLPLERELELLPLEFSEITSCTTEREEGESSQSNEVQYQYHQCQNEKEESFVLEQSKSSRRKLKYCNGNNDLGASEDCSTVVTKRNNRNCEMSYRSRDRYGSCGCGDRGQENSYHQTIYKPRQSYYRSIKYGNNNGYASESVPKGHTGAGTNGTVKTGSTTPKQVWEPLDSRKKINSTTNNTVANTNSTDFNANTTCEEVTDSCQKHENENVNETHSEECNGNLENEKMIQNTSNKDNNNCNGSPINHNRDLDNCSSCLSEGDSSSSSISTGGPHNESSSSTSDSEDASQQSEKGETIFQKDPPKESELQSCPSAATNQSPHPVIKERENIVKSSPFHMTAVPVSVQTQPQPVHIPQYYPPSVGLGFHNQAVPVQTSWAGPTNGYPFAQQGHFSPYSNHHLGFGIPVHYNGPAVHHYPPLGLTHQQPLPVYKQHTLSRLNMDPIANRRVALPENPNPVRRSVPMAASPSSGNIDDASSKKGEEKNGGLQSGKDDGSHFSLFHFGGPVGCRDHVKLDEESNRGVQCAREETLVKEYNLFSSSHSSFSFF